MTQPKGWFELGRLANAEQCVAAAEESLKSTSHGTDVPQYTTKCEEIMRQVLEDHGIRLDQQADYLKPGTKRRAQAIAQFRPNPTLASSSRVLLLIALTTLDKRNGMFSFLEASEDRSIPRHEWKEEQIVIEPGEGVMWRGDCARKIGEGNGGIMLMIRYD
ncbi:hypothetical protein LTR49_026520 [Elasticomyces elasticus]|nr:hypothetical protein LTR49_026520 [Elasticomyces elasticus]